MSMGFSHDQMMGDEAVIMATPAGFTSRWNNGDPVRDSLETEDFGVIGGLVQVIRNFTSMKFRHCQMEKLAL